MANKTNAKNQGNNVPANDTKQEKAKVGMVRLMTRRANFYIFIAIAVIGFVLLNLVAQFIPKVDTTVGGIFTLTETTKKVLNDLDDTVTIYALFDEVEARADVNSQGKAEQAGILDRYEAFSKVNVSYVDLDKKPGFLKNTVGEAAAANYAKGDFLVKCGDKVRHISSSEIYSTATYTQDIQTYVYATGIKLETKLTSAIIKVTSDTPIICYSTGFGEVSKSKYENLLEYISYNGYDIVEIDLNKDTIPENAVCMLFMGPTEDLSGTAAETLKTWLGSGRSAYFFMDIKSPKDGTIIYNDFKNFRDVMSEYGIDIEKTIVEESNEKTIANMTGDNIFSAKTKSAGSLENLASTELKLKNTRTITIQEKTDQYDNFQVASLIETSKDATSVSIDENKSNRKGTAIVAASGSAYTSYATKMTVSKIVVFGSSASFTNAFLEEFGSESARKIMNESMRWMELDIKSNVADTIEAKKYNNQINSYVDVTKKDATVITIFVMIVLPLVIIAAGFTIWIIRRHK